MEPMILAIAAWPSPGFTRFVVFSFTQASIAASAAFSSPSSGKLSSSGAKPIWRAAASQAFAASSAVEK